MRAITMKHFRNGDAIELASGKLQKDGKTRAGGESVPLGKILGEVFGVRKVEGVTKDGEVTKSLCLVGDFKAYLYSGNEVLESAQFYAPGYYAEQIAVALEAQGGKPVLFAAEISVGPSGRAIPYQYDVKSLVKRSRESGLALMEAALIEQGMLPASASNQQMLIEAPDPAKQWADKENAAVPHAKGKGKAKAAAYVPEDEIEPVE